MSGGIRAVFPVTKIMSSKFKNLYEIGIDFSRSWRLSPRAALGVLQTVRKEKLLDHVGTAYTVFVNAVPPLVSYSLVLVFSPTDLHLCTPTQNPGPSSILPHQYACPWRPLAMPCGPASYMVDELTRDYDRNSKIEDERPEDDGGSCDAQRYGAHRSAFRLHTARRTIGWWSASRTAWAVLTGRNQRL